MSMAVMFQTLVDALARGSVYGLIAVSINIMYLPSKKFNFAQGDFFVLGGLLSATLLVSKHYSWLSVFPIVLLAGVVLGAVEERVAIWPIARRDDNSHGWVLTTLAVSLIVENVLGLLYVNNLASSVPPVPPLSTLPFHVGGVSINSYEIGVFVWLWVVVLAATWFSRTRYGKAVLAVAEDRSAAVLLGIPASSVVLGSWAIGSGLALMGGLIGAPLTSTSIDLGFPMLIRGFEAAAIGGLGENRGAIAGGYIVAMAEGFGAVIFGPGLREAAIVGVFVVVLIVRPQGLFGHILLRKV